MGYIHVGDGSMLVTEILVTVLAILDTNVNYIFTLAPGTNIQEMSPTSKFCQQNPKIGANSKSPTSGCHQHHCHPASGTITKYLS